MKMRKSYMNDNEDKLNYWPSFTDLMTGMIFLFMLLIMVYFTNGVRNNRIQQKIMAEQKKEEVIESFEIKSMIADELKIVSDSSKTQSEDNEVLKKNYDNTISIEADIVFPIGKSSIDNIKPEAKEALSILASRFKNILDNPEYTKYIDMILVEGHTDDIPYTKKKNNTGIYYDNWNLSVDRAVSILKYLYIANPELQSEEYFKYFSTSGYSKYRPIVDYGDTTDEELDEIRKQNRRISFKIILKDEAIKDEVIKFIDETN